MRTLCCVINSSSTYSFNLLYSYFDIVFIQLIFIFFSGFLGSNGAKLTSAIRHTGHTYHEIGKLFEDQPRVDWEPLGDMLLIYKGIITSFPDILTVHRVIMTIIFFLYIYIYIH